MSSLHLKNYSLAQQPVIKKKGQMKNAVEIKKPDAMTQSLVLWWDSRLQTQDSSTTQTTGEPEGGRRMY
jgi:hypothetical protein